MRALSVSAYNRGCMWHVSALYPPCIGHRTGYSLHENAGISGLASADFEGVFAHSYKRWRPRLFLRALRKEACAGRKPTDPTIGVPQVRPVLVLPQGTVQNAVPLPLQLGTGTNQTIGVGQVRPANADTSMHR